MPNRTTPYTPFNYLVSLKGPRDPEKPLGCFSDVAGLKTEEEIYKYRGIYTIGDVTLKRGVVNSSSLWEWLADARANGNSAQREVTVTLRDDAGNPIQVFGLSRVTLRRYTGPPLGENGAAAELTINELVLAPKTVKVSRPS